MQERKEGTVVTTSQSLPVLQLRGSTDVPHTGPTQSDTSKRGDQRNKVRWKDDVVDNEHMNKKKSKVCCIFHPQQNLEDLADDNEDCNHHPHHNSSQSSESSSSESDSEASKGMDLESRRKARKERRRRKLEQKRSSSPNAYEVQPDYTQSRIRQT
ncbi:LADA_0A07184g1_1 [Lachancea dasiensis]|uniref:Type 1 phosphatases regulator n=1 Tax=Lachancea dasiensis TaxID=1072105 RepID=A0A1G4IPQ5_9SACH|nr:LADA_0A07184g1_1 [Lachancea dasiensis]